MRGWGGGKEGCSSWEEMRQCDFCQEGEGSFPFPHPDTQPCSMPIPALVPGAASHEPHLLTDHPIPNPGEGHGLFPALPVERTS